MRKDFNKFFAKLQLDYIALLNQKEKIDEEYGKRLLTDEQYTMFINYFNAIKVNYDRVSYVKYLLTKPPKFIEKLYEKLSERDLKKELQYYKDNNADEDAVFNENKESLDKIEELVNE